MCKKSESCVKSARISTDIEDSTIDSESLEELYSTILRGLIISVGRKITILEDIQRELVKQFKERYRDFK